MGSADTGVGGASPALVEEIRQLGLRYGLITEYTSFLVLEPGDLINTGTPPGVGMGHDPQVWLRAGDVVLTLNGRKVDGRFPEQLPPIQQSIASLPVGSAVKVGVKRGDQVVELSAVTEKLGSRVGEEWAFEKWGLTVRKVSRAYARENQLHDATGVVVLGVQPGYPAAEAGLALGVGIGIGFAAGGGKAELGSTDGGDITTGAATDDEHVELLGHM